MTHFRFASLVGALLISAHAAFAQSGPSVSLLATAERLARHGASTRDARTLLAAAEILVVVEGGAARVQRVGSYDMPSGPWQGALSSRSLLLLASEFASDAGDWELADKLASRLVGAAPETRRPPPTTAQPAPISPSRGATGGAVWADAFLKRGSQATYTIEFDAGGSSNRLQVSAVNTGANLECVLFDGTPGVPIATVVSVSGTCRVQWKQSVRAQMTLRIRNRSGDTFFVLSSN